MLTNWKKDLILTLRFPYVCLKDLHIVMIELNIRQDLSKIDMVLLKI